MQPAIKKKSLVNSLHGVDKISNGKLKPWGSDRDDKGGNVFNSWTQVNGPKEVGNAVQPL